VLARVYDEYLYESDLKGVIQPGTPANDSITLARSFIDNWIRSELMVQQARRNLPGEKMDFTRQLEDYENSLVIYTYEKELVSQKLDTIVTDEEIQAFYNGNPENFLLKENILRFKYVRLPLKSRDKARISSLLRSPVPEDMDRLNELCIKAGADYYLDDENWVTFYEVLSDIPIQTEDQESFLKYRKEVEIQDSLYVYLVRITDFKLKDEPAPALLVRDQIRDIILNKRKVTLLMKMQEDVFQDAMKNKNIETF